MALLSTSGPDGKLVMSNLLPCCCRGSIPGCISTEILLWLTTCANRTMLSVARSTVSSSSLSTLTADNEIDAGDDELDLLGSSDLLNCCNSNKRGLPCQQCKCAQIRFSLTLCLFGLVSLDSFDFSGMILIVVAWLGFMMASFMEKDLTRALW